MKHETRQPKHTTRVFKALGSCALRQRACTGHCLGVDPAAVPRDQVELLLHC